MDRRITARLNMANAVKQVCDTRTDVAAQVPAFGLLVTGLKDRITALNQLMKRLTSNTSGLSEDKTAWRSKLSLLLSIVCGAGVAYGRKIKDVVLEKNFNYAESTLFQLRDTELIQSARAIIEQQASVAVPLQDYGITAAVMADLTEALQKFEEKNPKPIANIYTSEADRSELLNKAFELSDFVLQDMMRAALIYKVLNPNFYQSLNNACRISKVGVRHEEALATAAAKNEAKEVQPLPNTNDMLKDVLDTMNTNPAPASDGTSEQPVLQVPSMNGV